MEKDSNSFDSIIGGNNEDNIKNTQKSNISNLLDNIEDEDQKETNIRKEPKSKSSKKSLKIISIILGGLLVFAAGSYIATLIIKNNEKQAIIEEEEKKEKEKEEEIKELKESPNPLAVLAARIGNANVIDEPITSKVTTDESKTGLIETSDGTTLYINNGKITAPVNECTVKVSTDFCLSGRGEYNEEKFEILLIKDLANSRLAEDPTDFKEIINNDGAIRAVMGIDINNDTIPISAISINGDTGFLYFFKAGTSEDSIIEILEKTIIQRKGE